MDNQWKVVGGFMVGAAAGVIAGLLTAPDSGKNTRKMIVDKGESLKNDLSSTIDETAKKTRKKYNEAVDNYASNGHDLLDSVRESIKVG